MSDERLEAGIAALRAGDKRRARRLLGQVVNDDPDNVAAWWFLSAVLEDPEQRARCLREVLRLRPDHVEARQMLNALERRRALVTPSKGVERPTLDAIENTQGDLTVVPPPEPEEDDDLAAEARTRDVRVALAGVIVGLVAILVTVVLVWSGAAPEFLGVQGPEPVPSEIPLAFGVPACAATGGADTVLVFINNTAVTLAVYRGSANDGEPVLALEPGEQGSIDTQPGQLARYAARAEVTGYAGASALIEVPAASMCRVPIE